jgi:hypothetical protein
MPPSAKEDTEKQKRLRKAFAGPCRLDQIDRVRVTLEIYIGNPQTF